MNPETTKHKLIETRKAEFKKTAEALQAASLELAGLEALAVMK